MDVTEKVPVKLRENTQYIQLSSVDEVNSDICAGKYDTFQVNNIDIHRML